jgi:hypothetical protein
MSDYVEWNPKRHGQRPPYWLPDMLTSVDGKNFARQPNWAWIAGSTYYVPREAVELPRIEPAPAQTDADRIEALTAEVERLRKALEAHENHMAAGQTLVVKYLVPVVDPDSIGKDDFVSRIIEHFDGPDQRAVQAKARAALEKQP